MVSKKASPIDGTVTIMVVLVLLVPSVLPNPTAEFRKIFLKKCSEFSKGTANGEKILATFEKAYVGKDKCHVFGKDYDELFAENPFKHPCGKTMLWSKTEDVVHKFTGTGDCYITMRHTLLGYVLNGLSWYGKVNSKETFTEHFEYCEPNPVSSFWQIASTKFAQHACGHVTVMLNGEIDEPYDPKSFFALYEVPNLQPAEVKQLTVLLVGDKKNQCNNESLKNLKNILKGKNIEYDCKEMTQSHIEKCIRENNGCGACL
uniref:ADP-ribosyl cyclase/cyclic ADP-ribose hydrolase 1-like n=1 Tax=Semicossyphus pulcher TaxID=241346 RepID=UPI0037E76651